MATNWILGKVSDALAPTVSSACATAGTFAGGAMNTVGSSINGVGESINTSIRYYGDGAKDYGNAIMDWTQAPGTRAQTASNPLGLSDTTGGGKAKVTTPTVYRAPVKEKKKEVVPVSKPKGTQKKVIDVPKTAPSLSLTAKPKLKVEPTKKSSPLKAGGTPVKAPVPYVSGVAKGVTGKVGSAASAAKPNALGKPAAGTTATGKAKAPPKKNLAANPLGLSF